MTLSSDEMPQRTIFVRRLESTALILISETNITRATVAHSLIGNKFVGSRP